MALLGEPPLVAERIERTVHGALAPLAYVPQSSLPTGRLRHNGVEGAPADRLAHETRPCHMRAGAVPNAAGSAFVEQGRTKVIASVFGPRQAGERAQREGIGGAAEGFLAVDLQFAPFASRVTSREEGGRRALMYSSLLHSSLESVVLLDRYAKTVFDVSLLVLEDDGAVLPAALTAASLALADANIEMRDLVAGATVHLVSEADGKQNGTSPLLLLDCDGDEERVMAAGSAVVHLGLCTSRGSLCLLHCAGPLPTDSFEQMVLLAKETAQAIGAQMRQCLESSTASRAAKRMRLSSEVDQGTQDDETLANGYNHE